MSIQSLIETPKPRLVTGPVTEPITIHQAKKHLEISTTDSTHDAQILMVLTAARQQWEHDTGEHYIAQTWEIILPYLCEIRLPHRPVASITSIAYYDTGNSSQTLATTVYALDLARSQVLLKYLQVWPATSDRWDAATITYVVGTNANSTTVPAVAQQAMLLLVGYYFEQRGDSDRQADQQAYERLVAKYMRGTYP